MIPGFIRYPLSVLLTRRWKKRKKNFLAIFNYHQATSAFDAILNNKGTWTQLTYLERQLLYLKKNFALISLFEGIRKLESNELSGFCAAISFDDGDISTEKDVYPLLKKHNIPATFFINSAYLDQGKVSLEYMISYLQNSEKSNPLAANNFNMHEVYTTNDPANYKRLCKEINELYGNSNPKAPLYVSRDFLKNLDERLVAIGLHGHEHYRFSMMPHDWQVASIEENIAQLSQYKSYRPIFAIPYGKPSDWKVQLVKLCLDKQLHIVGCNGGINLNKNVIYSRIPADSKNLKRLFQREIVG